jgi:hypothetical protein
MLHVVGGVARRPGGEPDSVGLFEVFALCREDPESTRKK